MNLTMEEKALRFAALFLTALTIVTCASLRYLPLLRTREQEMREERLAEQEFAESKAASEGNIQSQGQSQGRQQPSQAGDGFMSIPDGVDDDELPFN